MDKKPIQKRKNLKKKSQTPTSPQIQKPAPLSKVHAEGVARDGWIEEEFAAEPSHLTGVAKKNIDFSGPVETESLEDTDKEKPEEKSKGLLEEFNLIHNNPAKTSEKNQEKPSYFDKILGDKKVYLILGIVALFVIYRFFIAKYVKSSSSPTIRSRYRKK
ncbi:MAG: hypothetical protein AAF518_10070 [Spirochaetota bacterium]